MFAVSNGKMIAGAVRSNSADVIHKLDQRRLGHIWRRIQPLARSTGSLCRRLSHVDLIRCVAKSNNPERSRDEQPSNGVLRKQMA